MGNLRLKLERTSAYDSALRRFPRDSMMTPRHLDGVYKFTIFPNSAGFPADSAEPVEQLSGSLTSA